MNDFQQRVIDEKAELDSKIRSLNTFIQGVVFRTLPQDEQVRLIRQHSLMKDYSSVLNERINDF